MTKKDAQAILLLVEAREGLERLVKCTAKPAEVALHGYRALQLAVGECSEAGMDIDASIGLDVDTALLLMPEINRLIEARLKALGYTP